MSKIADHPSFSELLGKPACPNAEEIRQELHAILTSPVFHGTKRCQRFLEYVCKQSLAGEAAALKERTVAVDVFGRSPHSDLSDDTIVRVGAREVRKRLAQYYVTEEGAASLVRIELMPGSYAPEFRYVTHAPVKPPEQIVVPAIPEPKLEPVAVSRNRGRWALAMGMAAVVVLVVFAVAKLTWKEPADELFTRFWHPVYEGTEPLLLAVGNPIVYHPSARAVQLSESRLPPQKIPFQRVVQLPTADVNGADMIPVLNQYVGFGDMVAATEISSMLARKNRGTRVRMSENVSFAEMKQAQSVLIGAFTNRWTMELGQSWKFQFGRTVDGRAMIYDATRAANQPQWSIPAQADGTTPQDYLLVCRIRQSATGRLLVVAAGLKQFGKEAAGRLVADSAQLSVILAKLPKGWESKNLQLVLHSRIIGGAPAQPELVASQIW